MALSRLASQFAAEIKQHDWSDAPYRIDRAGHNRASDSNCGDEVLSENEAQNVRTNVMWVTAQVLGYSDPNFDVYEFAEASGVNILTRSGRQSGHIRVGLRTDSAGRYMRPGTWEFDPEYITTETSDFYHADLYCNAFQRGYRGAKLLTFPIDGTVPEKWNPCAHCVGDRA
ncbi:hypothetical protein ABZ883_35845 [Streptomyces sp. NPDC046977]|uniref:hypothetical protein n=1 Tax=Streptomyces sp. NPDC046977 TaxID=3154703 RepID=UPI0033D7EF13